MTPLLLVFIFSVEIICFLALLITLKRHFEKKYFTPAAKREINDFITAFNRQAESTLLLLDSRIKQARALIHSLEQYKNSRSPPNIAKQAPSVKKPAPVHPPSPPPLIPAPSIRKAPRRTAKPPPLELPLTKQPAPTEVAAVAAPQLPLKKKHQRLPALTRSPPRKNAKKPTPPHRSPTIPPHELGAKILMLAQEDSSLENIARDLALPLNEVRLRLSMHQQQLSKQQAQLKKRLTP